MAEQPEKTQEELKQEQLIKLAELQSAYNEVFTSKPGQIVLEDMAKRLFWRKPTIHENSNIMAFREGQRSVICHIETMMKLDLDNIKKLQDAA